MSIRVGLMSIQVTRTGLVEANRGFQDHMFKLYTGQSLKQVIYPSDVLEVPHRMLVQRHIDHASQSIGGSR